MNEILDEFVIRMTTDNSLIVEQHIRVLLKPVPSWVPVKIWKWLINKFIYIETKFSAT